MDNNKLIRDIILSQKDFHLLPRDENGYCVYRGYLECSSRGLNVLPDNLMVSGDFYCGNNNLTKLPDNLNVGDLWCSNNNLTKLPDNLMVKGALDCSLNNLTELPDNLVLGSNSYCDSNNITWLPDNLVVGGNLHCEFNQITKKINSKISGEIFMDDAQKKIYNRMIKIDHLKEKINNI